MPRGFYHLTAQETYLLGDSAQTKDQVGEGKFRMPYGIYNKEISIDELNRERTEKRFTHCMPVRFSTGNNNAVLSLEPLNPTSGETERRPQVLLLDKETGELTHSEEMTDIFYIEMKKLHKKYQGKNSSGSETDEAIFNSFYVEEPQIDREIEKVNPPEGMKNV